MRGYIERIRRRRLLAMAIDVPLVGLSYYLALTFRFEGHVPAGLGPRGTFPVFVILAIVLHLGANRLARVYSIVNRYIGLKQALRIVQAAVVSGTILLVLVAWIPTSVHLTPLTVIPVGGTLAMVAMVGVRFYSRIFHERSLKNVATDKNLIIVGAGRTADAIVRDLIQGRAPGTRAVGILDDDRSLIGMRIHDVPILGTLDRLAGLLDEGDVNEVLLASDEPDPCQVSYVHRITHARRVPVKTVPRLSDIVDGRATVTYARELRIEDFLGRPPVDIDLGSIAAYLRGKRVLVTGAAGSIGSEICRQISAFSPALMVLVDKDESGLYHLREELDTLGVEDCVIKPTSAALRVKMNRLFGQYRPQVVFHAAAFKHVPLMELSPEEAVINNIRGTMVIAKAAARNGAERVVNISTDKAVDPSCVMGATKLAGEYLMQLMSARYPNTHFCSVRFGNVLGSRGSVLPLFKQQIESGGPVTVTHPDMVRYFMTIEEAVMLVLQAAALTEEVPATAEGTYGAFILEMGQPVRIVDLAHRMISLLNGKGKDTYVIFTGLRPGEKLKEELFSADELALPTTHPLIHRAVRNSSNGHASVLPADFESNLGKLIALAERDGDPEAIVEGLRRSVPSYAPDIQQIELLAMSEAG